MCHSFFLTATPGSLFEYIQQNHQTSSLYFAHLNQGLILRGWMALRLQFLLQSFLNYRAVALKLSVAVCGGILSIIWSSCAGASDRTGGAKLEWQRAREKGRVRRLN